jgi:hypothetical protein
MNFVVNEKRFDVIDDHNQTLILNVNLLNIPIDFEEYQSNRVLIVKYLIDLVDLNDENLYVHLLNEEVLRLMNKNLMIVMYYKNIHHE